MFAAVAAVSQEGHEAFMKFIDSFDRKASWSELKANMSEAMLTFLGKKQNGEGE